MPFTYSDPVAANDPSKAGCLAGPKRLFGAFHRYSVAPVHTRFDRVQWFVWDADGTCPETGLLTIVRQEDTVEEAVAGLPDYNFNMED